MSTTKIITGVLIGAVTGAALGILFAPAKGSRTRKRLIQKGEEYRGSLQEKVDQFVDDLAEQFESVKGQATGYVEKGKDKMDSIKADVKHSLS